MGSLNDAMREQVFRFICAYIEERGFPPSLREISRGCYISMASVIRYLDSLESQGRLYREPNVSRGITLTKPDDADT